MRILIRQRAYYQEHREEILARVAKSPRRVEPPEITRIRVARRKAKLLGFFIEDVKPSVVWMMHGGRCGICGEYVHPDDFHVDHVMPLARGGLHGYVNVQPAHPLCNLRKGSRTGEQGSGHSR